MRARNEIAERRTKGYDELEISDEEIKVLVELDEQVFSFHETEIELMRLEEELFALQLELCKCPSAENIHRLIRIVERFRELLPIQQEYLQRRIATWKEYQQLLERKYNIKVNLEFSMVDLGFAAFVDLMKYVLYKQVIPEGILTGITWDITKSVSARARAKINQSMMNLLTHYGGLESLNAQSLALEKMQAPLENYSHIWKTEIPIEMIRLTTIT